MSKFLGPVHHWLHNKIAQQEHMELMWEGQVKELLSAAAQEQFQLYDTQFGAPNPLEDLASSIDEGNIHGWLQVRIAKAETRFALKYTLAVNEKPEETKKLAIQVNQAAAKEAAEQTKAAGAWNGDLEQAYKLLNNIVLEGMPCDHAGAVVLKEEKQLKWQNNRCLHERYWVDANGSVENHHAIRDAYNTAFFSALGNIAYNREPQGVTTLYTISF